jgi:hypothetical protein
MWKLFSSFILYSTKIFGRKEDLVRSAMRVPSMRKAREVLRYLAPRQPQTCTCQNGRVATKANQLIIIPDGEKITENDTILVRDAR